MPRPKEPSHVSPAMRSRELSVARTLRERSEVARAIGASETATALKGVAKPNSPSRALRAAGVALLLAPDPITAVPGALLLAASFAARRRDPLSVASVVSEARKIIAEVGSLG